MRFSRSTQVLLAIALGICSMAWGQAGGRNQAGRGNAAQGQPPAAQAAGNARGGRGATPAAPATASGAADFFDFDATASGALAIPDGPPAETHQKITIIGQALAYTTLAGFAPLHNATTGQSEAHIFFTSYAKEGVSDASTRPLVFFLGGAPGVAASFQEFGGFGPKRLDASGGATENPGTLLEQADLVFVNPIGTAYSRPDQASSAPAFWNTATDVASLAEFVRSYVRHFGRAASPLFLAGEDFGSARTAALAGYLHEHQIPVRGVILLSMTPSADAQAGDAQYINLLPSLIMTSWHYKKLTPELNAMSAEQIAGQARQFASREYLHALYNGERMTADERGKALADLARLTGLSKSFLASNNLRVTLDRFNGELMREQHLGLSPSDSRMTGFLPLPGAGGRGGGGGGGRGGAAEPAIDYFLSDLGSNFLAAYDSYLRRDLAFTADPGGVYYLTGGGVGAYTVNPADDASLSAAFARNPKLRLFVGVNYYDLSAPFYATEFTLAHLNVSSDVRAHNITVSHYDTGQMPYLDGKVSAKLQKDIAGFVAEAARK